MCRGFFLLREGGLRCEPSETRILEEIKVGFRQRDFEDC